MDDGSSNIKDAGTVGGEASCKRTGQAGTVAARNVYKHQFAHGEKDLACQLSSRGRSNSLRPRNLLAECDL
jgi:hypothetical protein